MPNPKPTMTQAVQVAYAAITPALPGLWLEEIPEDAEELHEAYYEHQGEIPVESAYHTGVTRPTMIAGTFAISFFSTSATTVETYATRLKTAFVPLILEMSDGQEATLFRGKYEFRATKMRSKENKPIYRATVNYVCKIGGPL